MVYTTESNMVAMSRLTLVEITGLRDLQKLKQEWET